MPQRPEGNFLELWVGAYRFALRTTAVLGVVDERSTTPPFLFRDRPVPFADLLDLVRLPYQAATPPCRPMAPFSVAVDTLSGWVALGADRVRHIPAAGAPVLTRLPPFGVAEAHLFEGALRMPNRLLLVLDAEALALYIAQKTNVEFL